MEIPGNMPIGKHVQDLIAGRQKRTGGRRDAGFVGAGEQNVAEIQDRLSLGQRLDVGTIPSGKNQDRQVSRDDVLFLGGSECDEEFQQLVRLLEGLAPRNADALKMRLRGNLRYQVSRRNSEAIFKGVGFGVETSVATPGAPLEPHGEPPPRPISATDRDDRMKIEPKDESSGGRPAHR